MAKVLVLYHSTYGHLETMANAVAEGAGSVEGVTVDIKRVPETVPHDLAVASHYKMDQAAPIATVDDLKNYDAIIVGAGTRFGTMASQMQAFWDTTGGLWFSGALIGKVGGAFTATATQHGGQETSLIVVGLPYSYQEQMTLDGIHGGSPYGATTVTGGDGSRQPSEIELGGARHQGRHIAEIARKLHG